MMNFPIQLAPQASAVLTGPEQSIPEKAKARPGIFFGCATSQGEGATSQQRPATALTAGGRVSAMPLPFVAREGASGIETPEAVTLRPAEAWRLFHISHRKEAAMSTNFAPMSIYGRRCYQQTLAQLEAQRRWREESEYETGDEIPAIVLGRLDLPGESAEDEYGAPESSDVPPTKGDAVSACVSAVFLIIVILGGTVGYGVHAVKRMAQQEMVAIAEVRDAR